MGNLTILNRFPQISANQLKKINEYKGDIYLLPSSNNNDWKCRYNEKISHLINNAEIITVGRARNPNPKYVNGRFISSQNHIIESKMNDILTNKFLYFFICKVGRTFYSAASTYPMFTRVDFGDARLLFPLINEQHKILKTFNSLDSLITLHQWECNFWKFRNFVFDFLKFSTRFFKKIQKYTHTWEQEKLGDLIDKGRAGGTPSTSNKDYYNGTIPFLSISDLTKSDGYIFSTEKTITKKGLDSSSTWIVPYGSLTLSIYATIGKVGFLCKELATSQAFYSMIINDNITKNFIFHFLRKSDFKNEWFKLLSTGTQANLNSEKVKNFVITLPINKNEQSKISSLFSNLDSLITLHQRGYKWRENKWKKTIYCYTNIFKIE
ncbi:restriction endonuclease subunit S [Mycoplasma capricolum subsp. capricolum]|uniref:restriction endonuclease subunit S n=1 Tax=Mycoplasma capricolum TaxID=2095 RepID=UPI003DA52CE7